MTNEEFYKILSDVDDQGNEAIPFHLALQPPNAASACLVSFIIPRPLVFV